LDSSWIPESGALFSEIKKGYEARQENRRTLQSRRKIWALRGGPSQYLKRELPNAKDRIFAGRGFWNFDVLALFRILRSARNCGVLFLFGVEFSLRFSGLGPLTAAALEPVATSCGLLSEIRSIFCCSSRALHGYPAPSSPGFSDFFGFRGRLFRIFRENVEVTV
jgi:hypothetical protein